MIVSLLLGCCGLVLGVYSVRIPLYLPTMLTALPFFAFGWWLKRHTNFLSSPVNLKYDIPIIAIGLLVIGLFPAPVKYSFNVVPQDGLAMVYPCGILGTMVVLVVAKMMKHLPLVSFWGRYSIMILCLHQFVIELLIGAIRRVIPALHPALMVIVVLLMTLFICHVMIHFMRRYMPHVTAQKDVIRIA